MLVPAGEKKQSAKNIKEYKEASKLTAEAMVKVGENVVNSNNEQMIKKALIEELKSKGVKCTEENIIKIMKNKEGKIIFLESGNEKAGYIHILKHENDFVKQGINKDDIIELIFQALKENKIIGSQGRGRPIYECNFKILINFK